MKIISWNVQGLGGSLCKQYKQRFRQELHKCIIRQVDIVMLQEHHLNESCTKVYGSLLPGNQEMLWIQAYGTTQLKGGLCMAIRDIWQVKMLDVGNLLLGRAQYFIMEFHNKKVGVLNLYAPNCSRERLKMWIELDSSLPVVDHWCVAGVFKMIKDPQDRSGEGGVRVVNFISLQGSPCFFLFGFSLKLVSSNSYLRLGSYEDEMVVMGMRY